MIRSSKISLKFANCNKINELHKFIDEYNAVVSKFIDIFWDYEKLPQLANKEDVAKVNTWLSARAVQAAAKQAIGIVKGTKTKQNRRLFIIDKLNKEGKFKKARKLLQVYNLTQISKPSLDRLEPQLDSRFVKFDFNSTTSFDGWITLSSLGDKLKIKLPFKKHKHFNKLNDMGKLMSSVRISKDSICCTFELPDTKIESGLTVGLDIGQTTTISLSTGQTISSCPHGHDYKTICQKLARKQKGSNSFKKTEQHRTNYINWSVNQINLAGVKQINRENIKQIYSGRRMRRTMKHWNYAELVDRMDKKFEQLGVQVNKVNPTYTSQRCFNCGWVRKENRKGKLFKCTSCGHTADADLNASLNLSLCLRPIGTKERLRQNNRTGFYWPAVGQESIVPATNKTDKIDFL